VQPPGVAHRGAAGRIPVLAHRRDHVAVGLGDRGREPQRGWQQFLVRDHVVRDPDPQRGRRVHEVAGQRHLAGPGQADPPGQVDQHRTGVHTDPQVSVRERGPLGRDDEVGHQGQLEPAGHGRPVHRRDHRHPRGGDRRVERRQVRQLVRAEGAQVQPRAERRVGSGEHDDRGVLAPGHRRADPRGRLDVDRVAHLRPVEGDKRDVAVPRDHNGRSGSGHATTALPAALAAAAAAGASPGPPAMSASIFTGSALLARLLAAVRWSA
jgi:hypothetical protein